jgi:predicted DCC family thiol-disulfide oxidoreductase YuxK
MPNTLQRTIYFDGLCQLCSREIDMFRRRVTDSSLVYVDIAADNFDAAAHGVDPVLVHKTMHVRNEHGQLVTGVDALIAMWEMVPGFRWLAWLTRLPVLKQLSWVGYWVFAWIRPKLPKRKRATCDTGTCPS